MDIHCVVLGPCAAMLAGSGGVLGCAMAVFEAATSGVASYRPSCMGLVWLQWCMLPAPQGHLPIARNSRFSAGGLNVATSAYKA